MRPSRSLPPLVVLLSLGTAACRPETPAASVARYTRAIEHDSTDATARYRRALAYRALGKPFAAIADMEAAVRLRPDVAEAHYQLGRLYAPWPNDYVAARAQFDTALRLNPRLAEGYIGRAGMRGWNGVPANNDSIRADIRAALGLNPRLATAYLLRGDLESFLLSQPDSALADYTTAIRLAPDDAAGYDHRGGLYMSTRHKSPDYDRAIADYGTAIRLAPDSLDYRWGRGNGYLQRARARRDTNDDRRAVSDFSAAAALDSGSTWAYTSLYHGRGLAYLDLGELDHAIADFTTSVTGSLPEERAYYDRGLAYARRGDRAHARADFRKIVSVSDDTLLKRLAREQLGGLGTP